MKSLLVVEDGHEYEEFARLFLADVFTVVACQSGEQALAALADAAPDAILLDLRFDRTPARDLIGDIPATAERLFAGDAARALRYIKEEQGTLVLRELRGAGCDVPVVFVHDFPARRLRNLQRMYGAVAAVPSFDAAAILRAFGASTATSGTSGGP